jgi:competence protein ComEA
MALTRRDWIAIALGMIGGSAVIAGAWLAVATVLGSGSAATVQPSDSGALAVSPLSSPIAPGTDLIVDVQGAVKHPGVVLLPPGSRVADALQAAGGYTAKADLNATAASLNLAEPLADGAQVYVPVIGLAAQPGTGGGGTGSGGTGGGGSSLVNMNTATPEELEALPGIGPVTVQLIVAARAEQPFTSLEEMLEREVLDRGQIEDVRDLVTF